MRASEIVNLQKALREIVASDLVVDGLWGSKSINALNTYAAKSGVSVAQGETQLKEYINVRFVTDDAFKQAAKRLNVPEHYVYAIAEVETNGASYLADGQMKILFERHWFYKKLKEALKKPEVQKNVEAVLGKGKVDERFPSLVGEVLLKMMTEHHGDICNAKSGGYKGGIGEWPRFNKAMEFDIEAACQSASYGGFQLMGFNHKACGYPTAKAMMLDLAQSESKQFLAMINFIQSEPGMLAALKKGDWAAFAKAYNGPNYSINSYDVKLLKASKKWKANLALA